MKSVQCLFYWIEVFKNTFCFLPLKMYNYLDTHILILCRLEAKILRGINNLSSILIKWPPLESVQCFYWTKFFQNTFIFISTLEKVY